MTILQEKVFDDLLNTIESRIWQIEIVASYFKETPLPAQWIDGNQNYGKYTLCASCADNFVGFLRGDSEEMPWFYTEYKKTTPVAGADKEAEICTFPDDYRFDRQAKCKHCECLLQGQLSAAGVLDELNKAMTAGQKMSAGPFGALCNSILFLSKESESELLLQDDLSVLIDGLEYLIIQIDSFFKNVWTVVQFDASEFDNQCNLLVELGYKMVDSFLESGKTDKGMIATIYQAVFVAPDVYIGRG